jgi:predicted dehydrogenase
MRKAGIIGCGKIADQHAEEIQRMPGWELAGVCDRELLMAKQLAERFRVGKYFSDVDAFLTMTRPDVVHITTPPASHVPLALQCLDAGCHLYIEKPFGLNASEAERLLDAAREKGLKITVGHNAQFTHAALRMRTLIDRGFLGGAPVHMESYYCYNLDNPTYARALLGDKNHWVRKLPGKLLHNIINHGISKIAEFLAGDRVRVQASGFSSPLLRSIGEDEIVDELRVLLQDEEGRTAFFTFSSQMRPVLHQLRLYGRKNSLIVDDDHQTVIEVWGKHRKSYLNQFLSPLDLARQYAENSMDNMKKFLRREFPMNYGMRALIAAFYRSISEDAPLPIPEREILLTSRIMDAIFHQVNRNTGGNGNGLIEGAISENARIHSNTGV